MVNLIRLNKYLSECGVCSRRKADEHILAGIVTINCKKAQIGDKIDPEMDKIVFDGNPVIETTDFVYYALNKPRGIISTASDEKNRKSVTDLVPKEPRVYPVGRLDKDSEGLIILTNDGDMTQNLTHPSSEHEKEYIVIATRMKNYTLNSKIIETRLMNGISIKGVLMKADTAKATPIHDSKFLIQITIHTGYNRQIRKMCDKIGLEVTKLKRIRIGKLKLDDLDVATGEYKIIDKQSII